jgi:NTE family protein
VPPPLNWLKSAVELIRGFAYAKREPPKHAPRRPRIGLALGGGFARGIAHLGVLRVLEAHHIPIDCIAGTSVGALIAAGYATGVPLAKMEHRGATTQFKDFGKWTLSRMGFASNERLERYLSQVSTHKRFEDAKIPLAIAATDLGTGEAVYFTEGDIGPALRASCAYPGLFLPVEHQGRVLVDGFLAAPVPVDAVKRMGAEFVIAVYLDSAPADEKPANVLEVIGRAFSIMARNASRVWRQKSDVILEPDVGHFAWDDFGQAQKLIAAGEACTRAALPRIQAALSPRERVPTVNRALTSE